MKALFFHGGRPVLDEVRGPGLTPGCLHVEVHYSAVSPGTESNLLEQSGRSMLALALEKRHRIDRLWQAVKSRDFDDLRRRVARLSERSQAWLMPGYSAAGVVRACGPGVDAFAPGDRVAVAGAGYAPHADEVVVPRNLAVAVPRGLPLAPAATVAIGAIALQAVRRAESRVGETVLVLGLGLLGQLTARILLASGCRVLGWDPRADRRAGAAAFGVETLPATALADLDAALAVATAGLGADQVIVAAAGGGAATEAGARATRRAGRLVLLGDTPVAVSRGVAYERELEIRLSTSYGPGRYDPSYEEGGRDYPYAHVRWSENRNMAAWLALLAAGRVVLEETTLAVRGFEEAASAYLDLRRGTLASLGLVFRHPAAATEPVVGGVSPATSGPPPIRAVAAAQRRPSLATPVRVALLGTGGYASGVLLPVMVAQAELVRFELLAGSQPARREPLARRYSFARAGEDYAAAAADPGIDLVVIATRHDRHAALVRAAWEAGHAVYCEKPLALTLVELDELESVAARLSERGGTSPFLALGFNRRFAPTVLHLMNELAARRGPLQIAYRVQAGPLPASQWIRGPEGGGRLIGECVHMIDLCRFLSAAPLVHAVVVPGGAGPTPDDPAADNFQIALGYADGSTATILYTARGSSVHPKERIECHWDGRTAEIDDFHSVQEAGRAEALATTPRPDKGQTGLWRACLAALTADGPQPTPWAEVLETSRAAIALEAARRQT